MSIQYYCITWCNFIQVHVHVCDFGFVDGNLTELDGYNPFKGRAPENPNYFPFGKPGAGAPITDSRGKPQVQRHKVDFNLEGETSADQGRRRRRAEEYLHELSM